MAQQRSFFSETWRVLAYTLAIALSFIALQRLQLAIFNLPGTAAMLKRFGLLDARPQDALLAQAEQVAAASRDALARLPQGHRMAALRLGYDLAYANYRVAGYAMAPPQIQANARQRVEAQVAEARRHAQTLGVGEVELLPATSLKQFTELCQRYEADHSGLAARIEKRVSPLHRHLYLLGAQAGCEAARVADTQGLHSLPPATPIRRNAVLAGIDEAVWLPLIAEPNNETPAQVMQRYAQAIDTLMAEVARQDTGAAR